MNTHSNDSFFHSFTATETPARPGSALHLGSAEFGRGVHQEVVRLRRSVPSTHRQEATQRLSQEQGSVAFDEAFACNRRFTRNEFAVGKCIKTDNNTNMYDVNIF